MGSPIAYLALGVIALSGAGYNAGLLMIGDRPDDLVVVGPSRIDIDHPNRNRPLEVTYRLRNPTQRPIRIVDVKSNCSCSTTLLSGQTVEPGAVASLVVRVNSFDTYAERFAERTTVRTDSGRIELWVAGTLPVKREALVFPPLLHLEPDGDGMWPERTIRLRVPQSCARDATDVEVRPILLGPTTAEVVEEPPSGPYRNFAIRVVTLPALDPGPDDGRLLVEAGCSAVEIPVRFAGRATEED